MKAYLFVYSDSLGTRDQVKNCLSTIKQVYTWRYDMPNSFYLLSEYSANEIATSIRQVLGNQRFFITEIFGSNKQGWLSKETWHLINHKKHLRDS